MSVESIAALSAAALTQAAPAVVSEAHNGVFETLLDGVREVNLQMQAAAKSAEVFALGATDNLHRVVMDGEQARLSFELLLQVRNKVLEAYQELMRMQV